MDQRRRFDDDGHFDILALAHRNHLSERVGRPTQSVEQAAGLPIGMAAQQVAAWKKGKETMTATNNDGTPIQILLVEDSPGDVRLTQEAFREANGAVCLHVASDGLEAMAFLRREGAQAHVPRPDLILLDLNLPKIDGREVLAQIKDDDSLKTIPTVILTTSDAEADIIKSYQLQANCYLTKPVQLDAFEIVVKAINDFWLSQVRLPRNPTMN